MCYSFMSPVQKRYHMYAFKVKEWNSGHMVLHRAPKKVETTETKDSVWGEKRR